MSEPQKPEDRFGWDEDTPIEVTLPKKKPEGKNPEQPKDSESGAG